MKPIATTCLRVILLILVFNPLTNNFQAKSPKSTQPLLEHNIRINKVEGYEVLETEADIAYVDKIAKGDMGVSFPSNGYRYVFKVKLPDGIYRRFINGIMLEEITFISGKIEGIHKTYDYDHSFTEEPYRKGKRNGYSVDYRHYIKTKYTKYYQDNIPYITTGVDSTKNIIYREYDVKGVLFRYEIKKNMELQSLGPSLTKGGIASDSIRNGLYELASPSGKYQLLFRHDEIKWWRWLDKQGNTVVEVHAKLGQRL